MQKLHIAISTRNLAASVKDYSVRLCAQPCLVVEGEYALWRTETLNVSVRRDTSHPAGALRHLGWEENSAPGFISETDVNGITWEHFSARQQADEINNLWPQARYRPASPD